MGFFNKILDWSADKVQSLTGEKERRQLVERIKTDYHKFKRAVKKKVTALNEGIKNFNKKVEILNSVRKASAESNIVPLYLFLQKYGNVSEPLSYCDEREKNLEQLPKRQFEQIEDYISDVDWSKDEVFNKTFFLTPLGMKFKTRKQNLSMREYIHEFQLTADETLRQLELREYSLEIEQQICELYTQNITFISDIIKNKIVPELILIEAFFQAEQLKNKVIASQPLENIHFKNDITMLMDTVYDRHYTFVKNAFVFYVLSCKIYSTPILTKLLNKKSDPEDIDELEKYKEALLEQGEKLEQHIQIRVS